MVQSTESRVVTESQASQLKRLNPNLSIRQVEGRGRAVYYEPSSAAASTLVAVSEGSVLLREAPYACAVSNADVDCVCATCFKPARSGLQSLLRCAACKTQRYCSRECQKADWADHKEECRSFVRLAPRQVPTAVRIICRILRRRARDPKSFAAIECLRSNRDKWDQASLIPFAQVSMAVQQCVTPEAMLGAKEMVELWCQFSCNSYAVMDSELVSAGVGVYPLTSMINHSCYPNCAMIFDGSTITVRCIRPIQPGEEVTVSYLDVCLPWEKRQDELARRYFFQCQCSLCLSTECDPRDAWRCTTSDCERPIPRNAVGYICPGCSVEQTVDEQKKAAVEDSIKRYEIVDKMENRARLAPSRISSLLQVQKVQSDYLHYANYHLLSTRRLLNLLQLSYKTETENCTGSNTRSLSVAQDILRAYRRILTRYHPQVSVQLTLVGRAWLAAREEECSTSPEVIRGSMRKAKEMLSEICHSLAISHGQKDRMTQEINERAAEVEEYLQIIESFDIDCPNRRIGGKRGGA